MNNGRHAASSEERDNAVKTQIRRRKALFRFIRTLLITAAVVYLLFGVLFGISVVHGDSMEPALHNGDIVFFYRLQQTYHTGDIVLAERDNSGDSIKRIVGLPVQTVDIDPETHKLLIDGAEANEPFIYEETIQKTGCSYPLTLGEDEYFILGDHRENSIDSRNYGPISADKLHGVVLTVLRFGT